MAEVKLFTSVGTDIYAILHENSQWARLSLIADTNVIYYYSVPAISEYKEIKYGSFDEALEDLYKIAEVY